MDLSVDVDNCIGAGQCLLAAPAIFDQSDDDGTVVLLRESVGSDEESAVREAVEACPARVIAIVGE